MSLAAWAGLGLLLAAAAAVVLRAATGAGRWRAAAPLLLAAGCAAGVVVGGRGTRPTDTVVILDQPLRPDRREDFALFLQRLRDTGTDRVAVIEIADGDLVEPTWHPIDDPDLRPGRRPTLPAAVTTALDWAAQRGTAEAVTDVLRQKAVRVVVTASDPRRWKELTPLVLDDVLSRARAADATLDLVELAAAPLAAAVDISFPFPLPASKPLHEAGRWAVADVTVQAPPLVARKGQTLRLVVTGTLHPTAAVLQEYDPATKLRKDYEVDAVVTDDGSVSFSVRLDHFRHPTDADADVELPDGFVLCELTIKETTAAAPLAKGAGYLPVRAATVAVVCGDGSGSDRLRPAAAANQPGELRALAAAVPPDPAGVLARAGPLARPVYLTPAEFAAALADNREIAQLVCLHEMPPGFWTKKTVERLTAAVSGGMHLLVVDPPVRGPAAPAVGDDDPASADQLAVLLPAFAQTDARGAATPPRRTTDATPVLNFVFDYGRWGRFKARPGEDGQSLADAVGLQLQAANAMLDDLTDEQGQRLTAGKLELTAAGIAYQPDPPPATDRVRVRVAPRLSATDVDTPFADTLLPSGIELRVASLFEAVPTFGFARIGTGLDAANPAAPPAGPYLPDDPHCTPNQAVVVFTGPVPQPLANADQPNLVQPPLRYRLGGGAAVRQFAANAEGAVAGVLLHGGTVAVVELRVPEYETGIQSLTLKQPDSDVSKLRRFGQDVSHFLTKQVPADIDARAGPAFLATAAQAKARLLRFSVDVTPPTRNAAVAATGKQVAAGTASLFRSPRSSLAVAVGVPDRWVDERVGPVAAKSVLTQWQLSSADLTANWPPDARWAAPRRFRTLEFNPAHAAAELLYAVDVGGSAKRLAPQPLAAASVVGNGCVAAFGYSPFEVTPGWPLPNTIHQPNGPKADRHGLQRLLDAGLFLTRLNPLPVAGPRVREVTRVDARQEIELVADFLPAHATQPQFWRPVLRTDGAEPRESKPLEVIAVSFDRGEVRYRATPVALSPLFKEVGADLVSARPQLGGNVQPPVTVRRPEAGSWAGLTAYQSAATAAAYSGGGVKTTATFGPVVGSRRMLWVFGAAAGVLAAAVGRGWWRWRKWFRPPPELPVDVAYPMYRLDVSGLIEQLGVAASLPRSGRRNGILDHVARITGRDKPAALRRELLVRLGLGIATDLLVERRVRPQRTRVDVAVQLGASVRTPAAAGMRPKVRLAAVAAQMIAEIAWALGAEVRLLGFGLEGGLRTWGPLPSRDRENGLIEEIEKWVADVAADAVGPLAEADCEPGTLLVWVSDFLTDDPRELLTAGAAACEDGGQFAAVAVRAPEDAEEVGVGWVRPFVLLDRTGLTPTDLATERDALVAAAARQFAQQDCGLATFDAAMTGEQMVEELTAAGIPGYAV